MTNSTKKVNIEDSWYELLQEEFDQPYFKQIKQFLLNEKAAGKTIFPPGPLIFNAFNSTPVEKVKVVVLGQDPYHNPGEAMGLSFSVPKGVRVPPSLRNIYKEMNTSLGIAPASNGDLTAWTNQGVFLLNAMLTVEQRKAGSHRKIGWQQFTDAVISKLSAKRKGLVFLLWGNFAKGKRPLIDESKHHVFDSAHPSPLAGNRFQGCGHFVKANKILEQQGQSPINWKI